MRLQFLIFGLVVGDDGYTTLDSGVRYGIEFGHFRLSNGIEVAVVSDADNCGAVVLELGQGAKTEANPKLKAHSALMGSTQYPGTEGIYWYAYRHSGYVKVDVGYESVSVEVKVKADGLRGALERVSSCFNASARPDEERGLWMMNDSAPMDPIQAVHEAESNMFSSQPRPYTASQMKLAVVGREPIQEQIKIIADTFGTILCIEQEPIQTQAPFGPEHLEVKILIVPVKKLTAMEIQFVIPTHSSNHGSRPLQYIDYLLRNEAEGSLLYELQSRGLIRSAHTQTNFINSFAVLKIEFSLDNLSHHQEILSLMEGYLSQMWETLNPDLHAELQSINTRNWLFQDKLMAPEIASLLAKGLVEGAGPRLSLEPTSTFNYTLVQDLLTYLVRKNMRVLLVSPVWANRSDLMMEPKLKTNYTKLPLVYPKLSQISTNLPPTNHFITTNFNVLHHQTHNLTKLHEGLYHHPGLPSPKVSVHLGFQQETLSDCYCQAGLLVLREMIWKSITHLRSMATAGGIELDLYSSPLGLTFHIFGFSDKIPQLIQELTAAITIDTARLTKAISSVNATLDSVMVSSPVAQAADIIKYSLMFGVWHRQCVRTNLDQITPAAILDINQKLFYQGGFEALVVGNLLQADVIKISQTVEQTIHTLPKRHLSPSTVALPVGNSIYQIMAATKLSAIEYYVELFTKDNFTARAATGILAHAMAHPLHDQLCITETLCTLAVSGQQVLGNRGGLRIVFMSRIHPRFLEERVDAFLSNFEPNLENINISSHVQYLLNTKYRPPTDLRSLATNLWQTLQSDQILLDPDSNMRRHLPQITQPHLQRIYNEILPSNPHRRKLSIHIISPESTPITTAKSRMPNYITNLETWKSQLLAK